MLKGGRSQVPSSVHTEGFFQQKTTPIKNEKILEIWMQVKDSSPHPLESWTDTEGGFASKTEGGRDTYQGDCIWNGEKEIEQPSTVLPCKLN